jgi:hypothetical protein
MRFYSIADLDIQEVNHWYLSRERAEAQWLKMIGDEPEWVETMRLVLVDMTGAEPVIEPVS